MPEILKACESMGPQIEELFDNLSVLRHPVQLKNTITYNIGKHKVKLGLDVAKARKDQVKGKSFAFGEDIATILEVITKPVPSYIASFDREVILRSTFCNDTFNTSTIIDPYNLSTCDYNEILFGVLYGIIDE
jgi:hypothetical protein